MHRPWNFVVFVSAVIGHDVYDDGDHSYLLQGYTSSVGGLKLAPSTHTLPMIFCWVIEGPGTGPLVKLVTQQMAGCDDYLVFANYSSNEKMVKLYTDDMILDTVDGWLNNTWMVAKAYDFLSNSQIPDNFDWIVKVDSDTFFRPGALFKILTHFDADDALAVSSWLFLEGAMEVVSRGVFRRYGRGALFNQTLNVREDSMFDDKWLDYAVKHMGGNVIVLPNTECISLVLNGYNVNKARSQVNHQELPQLAKHCNEEGTWHPDLLHENFGTSPPCVRRDVVAIHPVKRVDHYLEFQRMTK